MKRCEDISWEMQDEHFGESAADARLGDYVWHYKGDDHGHVLTQEVERREGWVTYTTLECECGEAEVGDHHVVMMARRASDAEGRERDTTPAEADES